MKLTKYILFLIVPFTVLFSCTKEESDKVLSDQFSDNTWTISYYFDEKDETSNFTGYVFEFQNTGILKASKGGTSTTGSWIIDNNSSKLTINFPGATNYLENLNDDWLLIDRTNEIIKLKDDKTTSEGEILHFTRKL
ncbi:MAG: hypothetical protein Q7J34_11990 [Bacteroidales bacterium]|nr:hypothetical protein [Bacteroidales bacterium]